MAFICNRVNVAREAWCGVRGPMEYLKTKYAPDPTKISDSDIYMVHPIVLVQFELLLTLAWKRKCM